MYTKLKQIGYIWVRTDNFKIISIFCFLELEEIEKEKAKADAESKKKQEKDDDGEDEYVDIVTKEYQKERCF